MKTKIRHPRLYAFYESKVLNSLLILIIVSLYLPRFTTSILMPAVCGITALVFFLSYATWFWIKKPVKVTINPWLSDFNGYFIAYYLIVTALDSTSILWYLFPIVICIPMIFANLINSSDSIFEIAKSCEVSPS